MRSAATVRRFDPRLQLEWFCEHCTASARWPLPSTYGASGPWPSSWRQAFEEGLMASQKLCDQACRHGSAADRNLVLAELRGRDCGTEPTQTRRSIVAHSSHRLITRTNTAPNSAPSRHDHPFRQAYRPAAAQDRPPRLTISRLVHSSGSSSPSGPMQSHERHRIKYKLGRAGSLS